MSEENITEIPIKFKARKQLKRIMRPCDYGLEIAWNALETQLGTIEGYNRLVSYTNAIAKKINRGEIKKQNPIYATNTRGESPK